MQSDMCMTCKNLEAIYLDVRTMTYRWECRAFDKIPDYYISGEKTHIKSDGKDKGVVYEPNIVDSVLTEKKIKISIKK